MLCVTRNRFSAGFSAMSVYARARFAIARSPVVVARVQPGPDRRRADVELLQLLRGVRHIVGAASDAGGVAAEFLAERDRHGILQMRAAGLEHVRELARLPIETVRERSRRADEAAVSEEQRQARRRREHVVRRLAHVHVIVRMHARVGAARLAEELGGAVRDHFVRVHVVRGARARLIDVHDELVAQVRPTESRRRPATMALAMAASSRPRAALLSAAAFLTRIVAVTRSAGARSPLMGKFSTARAVWTP